MSSQLQSPSSQLPRKRPLSPNHDSEVRVDRHVKKTRVSITPASLKQDKKRRRKRKRTTSVVENKSNARTSGLDRNTTEELISASATAEGQRDGLATRPHDTIASSSHSLSDSSLSFLRMSSSSDKVEGSFSPVTSSSNETEEAGSSSRPLDQVSVLETQISQLKNQLSSQKTQLDKQSNLISSFQASLTCQICIDLMYKPYALSPCGHLACYDCLVLWFKTPATGTPHPEDSHVRKRKTCPHCRAVLRERPIEVYSIKDMVNALHSSGLTTDLPPHGDNLPGASEVADPWKGIFPKQQTYHHPVRFSPLPLPLASDMERWHHPDPDSDNGNEGAVGGFMGIYDQEDGIYRCNDCLHEIWDGVCSSCGRVYAPFNEPIDLDDIGEGSDDIGRPVDGPDFAQIAFMNQAMQLGMMLFPPPMGFMRYVDGDHAGQGMNELDVNPIIEGVDEDDEDEDYESSFIDDDDGAEIIDLDDSDDSIGSEHFRRAFRAAARVFDSNSDGARSDASSVSSQIIQPSNREARGPQSSRIRRRQILSEDEETIRNDDRIRWDSDEGTRSSSSHVEESIGSDDDEDDDGSLRRPPINLAHLMQEDLSDYEDEESQCPDEW